MTRPFEPRFDPLGDHPRKYRFPQAEHPAETHIRHMREPLR